MEQYVENETFITDTMLSGTTMCEYAVTTAAIILDIILSVALSIAAVTTTPSLWYFSMVYSSGSCQQS
ncbi:hypothetical protein I4U23_017051 [Adineta vaga]|nr:hypothetical protein I4U23_017051 [Adineta vaga]